MFANVSGMRENKELKVSQCPLERSTFRETGTQRLQSDGVSSCTISGQQCLELQNEVTQRVSCFVCSSQLLFCIIPMISWQCHLTISFLSRLSSPLPLHTLSYHILANKKSQTCHCYRQYRPNVSLTASFFPISLTYWHGYGVIHCMMYLSSDIYFHFQ